MIRKSYLFILFVLVLSIYSCDDTNGYTEIKYGSLGERCYENLTCDEGFVCENNKCKEAEEVITCNPECEEWEKCNNTTCETLEDRCNDNSDCNSENNKICDISDGSVSFHKCIDDIPELECVKDSDCSNDKICNRNNECIENSGIECIIDDDCKDGKICDINNTCVEKTCVDDNDCTEFQFCDETKICVSLPISKTFALDGLRLNKGEFIQLNKSKLIMQTDGNLVLYGLTNNILWQTATSCTEDLDCYFRFQDDGNMVVYDKDNNPLWFSTTHSINVDHLIIDNEKLGLYDVSENIVWSSLN